MNRIEPTIGTLDLASNPAADAKLLSRAKSRRVRAAIANWSITLLLLAALVAACYAGAVYAGIMPEQLKPGTPGLLARLFIVVGFFIFFGSQCIGALILFRYGFERGALALLLPGYIFIALKRSGIFWQVMGPWCAGLGLVVLGTLLLNGVAP